jgi:hypothetical protein
MTFAELPKDEREPISDGDLAAIEDWLWRSHLQDDETMVNMRSARGIVERLRRSEAAAEALPALEAEREPWVTHDGAGRRFRLKHVVVGGNNPPYYRLVPAPSDLLSDQDEEPTREGAGG